jgi:glycosyltransferase involved in cell wall biosynthesis
MIGYVLAASRNAHIDAAIEAGFHPRAEYSVFFQRNRVKLFTFQDVQNSRSVFARLLRRSRSVYWDLAWTARRAQARLDGLIATGEDVGLPLALFSQVAVRRAPVYVITHGSYFGSPKFSPFMRLLRHATNVHYLCLSESLRRALIDQFGVPERQVHNTGYGVDTQFFQPPTEGAGAPVIVSAGTAKRDYRTLINAVAPLNVPLRIAADSAWFPSHVDTGRNLPPNVEVRSWGNYQGLRDLYAQASFVVVPLHPARHACGYAVIAEAMAMGKAVIATRTDAISDFLVDGETGFYVQPGDVHDLRAKLAYLLDNPAVAQRMGRASRERMEQLFSVEAYCQRMEQVTGLRREPPPVRTPAGRN